MGTLTWCLRRPLELKKQALAVRGRCGALGGECRRGRGLTLRRRGPLGGEFGTGLSQGLSQGLLQGLAHFRV